MTETQTPPTPIQPTIPTTPSLWDMGERILDADAPQTGLERIESFMEKLNDEQKAAVSRFEGPILVVAGAGTGKTRVLTSRIALLIERGHAEPGEILAVTFTNKAAAEMRTRIIGMIGERARGIRMGSFHAISMVMLRHHPRAAGLRDDRFVIPDEPEQRDILEKVMRDLGIRAEDEEGVDRKRATRAWKAMVALEYARIQGWKEEGWSLDIVGSRVDKTDEDVARSLKIYRAYQESLLARNACDYADLLLHMVRLFRSEPDIKEHWASKFKYVLVDEFQDTNYLQYEWLTHLAVGHRNICVVGDPDQSVYQWRGARPEILENFRKDWAGCHMVTVELNYRSTQEILDVANAVVVENHRLSGIEKSLRSKRTGAAVKFDMHNTLWDEARAVIADVARRVNAGHRAGDIALLFRSAMQMRPYEEQLTHAGIPYVLAGGMKFYEREEVKDANAYLRLAIDPADELAFLRVSNKPTREIGEHTAQQAADLVRRGQARDFVEACREVAVNGRRVKRTSKMALEQFASLLQEIREIAAQDNKPGDLMRAVMEHVGYLAWRISSEDERVREREESLEELYRSANEYQDAAKYLQTVALFTAADVKSGAESVRLSTIHAAKGLEFGVVYTPCLEEGVLPNARSMREAPQYGLLEERRIAHVAWTRAKDELLVSCARFRYEATQPSRFLVDAGFIDEATGATKPRSAKRTPAPADGLTVRRALRPRAAAAGGSPKGKPRFWTSC